LKELCKSLTEENFPIRVEKKKNTNKKRKPPQTKHCELFLPNIL